MPTETTIGGSAIWPCSRCGGHHMRGLGCVSNKPARSETAAKRDYNQRCATCSHNVWQNEAVGDCRVFHKDVLHENIEPCAEYVSRDPSHEPTLAATKTCPVCSGYKKAWQWRAYGNQQYHGEYYEKCDNCAGLGTIGDEQPMTQTTALSNYECPECEFSDDLPPGDHWCPMCTEARGRDVYMRCNGFRTAPGPFEYE